MTTHDEVEKVEPSNMMKLGSFTFSLNTAAYQSISRSSSYKWEEQGKVGSNQSLQFVGVDADSMTLQGVIYPTFRGGLGQVSEMRALAGRGKPLELIDGYGDLKGFWCIKSITEKMSDFLQAGLPQKIEFTLELKYFGERV